MTYFSYIKEFSVNVSSGIVRNLPVLSYRDLTQATWNKNGNGI